MPISVYDVLITLLLRLIGKYILSLVVRRVQKVLKHFQERNTINMHTCF